MGNNGAKLSGLSGSVIDAIEEETGRSFWCEVEILARQGHSVRGAALALGYTDATPLRNLLKRHGKKFDFAFGNDSIAAKESHKTMTEKRKEQIEGLRKIRLSKPDIMWIEHNGIKDSVEGWSCRIGISRTALRARWLKHKAGDERWPMHRVMSEERQKPTFIGKIGSQDSWRNADRTLNMMWHARN